MGCYFLWEGLGYRFLGPITRKGGNCSFASAFINVTISLRTYFYIRRGQSFLIFKLERCIRSHLDGGRRTYGGFANGCEKLKVSRKKVNQSWLLTSRSVLDFKISDQGGPYSLTLVLKRGQLFLNKFCLVIDRKP